MRPASDGVSVCAVVVTYNPDAAALTALLERVEPQVAAVVIVDNASVDRLPVALSAPVFAQPVNVGLAAAQNIGIAWARRHGHSHVLLLDQDSTPAPTMVAHLTAAWQSLVDAGERVAAVGPRFHDAREDTDAPFVRVAFPVSEKIWCGDAGGTVRCDFLIGSGALIPLAVLAEVGVMDPGLFIDNVDLDWSFRARSRGYALFGVCAATMDHRLGDGRRAVLFGRRQVATHGPTRLYYIMRNRLLLYRLATTPRVWIAQDILRVPVKFLLFAVLIGPRARNARFMFRGLLDGIRGRRGPVPDLGGGR